jgi:TolA-binding protein
MLGGKRAPESALALADAAIAEGLKGDDLQEAHLLRGHSLRKLRRPVEAVTAYEEAVGIATRGPLSRVAQRERADVLVRDLRDFEGGEKAYEDLIASLEKAPRRERGSLLSQALVALADCRLRMGRYETAEEALRIVEEREVNPAGKEEAAFQQAEILFYAGSVEEAKTGYERVVEEFGGGRRVNDALERILLLTRAAEAGPLPLAALGQIAYHRRVGSPQRVLEIAAEGAQFCGDCAAAEDFLRETCLALLELSRIEEAASSADSLADRFPDSGAAPGVLRAVADRMRERQGDTKAVMERYEDLVIRFPQSHEALEVRSLLRSLRKEGPEGEEESSEVVG